MNKYVSSILTVLVLLGTAGGTSLQASPSYTPSPGYTAESSYASPAGTLAGFDFDTSGNLYLFRGNSIVKRAPGGSETDLYTFSSDVYGSFLKVKDSTVYFGESSNGSIKSVSTGGGTVTDLGSLGSNYDLAFNSSGQAFIVANPGWAGTKIYNLDLVNGTTDEIADIGGYSGPLAFDTSGNLYYGKGSEIISFTGSQVNSALGTGTLGETDWSVFATGLDSIGYFAFDSAGDLFSSSYTGAVTETNNLGSSNPFGSGTSPSTLRFVPGSGDFETGNPDGGHLYVNTTDWFAGQSTIFEVTPVPEPATVILLAGGLFSFLFRRKQ